VRRSNHGAASWNGAVKAPDVITTTSSAAAGSAASSAAMKTMRASASRLTERCSAM
jgi:hypothetical protein